jgi:dTDP-4-amino-4,6-dideoxygalactose transaminase
LADEHGIWYVADAAQSLGAERNGMPASALADAWVVSFTTGKTLFAGEGGAVLTNNTELYQKLIWHTQHPSRQVKTLGSSLSNEFSFNARIHPLAAVWATAAFDESLKQLRRHRDECFRLIKILNETGLINPILFEREGISSTFFRLSASWKAGSRPHELLSELRERRFLMRLVQSPLTLLYRQAAFVAQYGRKYDARLRCRRAEREAPRRFCLSHNAPHSPVSPTNSYRADERVGECGKTLNL